MARTGHEGDAARAAFQAVDDMGRHCGKESHAVLPHVVIVVVIIIIVILIL